MLDPNILRTEPDRVRANLARRNDPAVLALVDAFLRQDQQWRDLTQQVEKLRAERNTISRKIAELKKAGSAATEELQYAAVLPQRIAQLDEQQQATAQKRDATLMRIPNILDASVPDGKDDTENRTIRLVGKKPKFAFPVQSHVDLLAARDIADIERAAKIAGARFWFLKGDLARLDLALQQYAVDFMAKRGYLLIRPPLMMARKPYEGVTDLKDFASVMYKIEGEDLYLIATSEHPLTAMYMEEIIDPSQLPFRMAGISPCFRKEAGAHGRDTKGIFRGHQFDKVEQIILCKSEDSGKLHEELLKNAIDFFQSLGLHFRVVNICTGDIGNIATKKYDLEVWMPAQNTYREVVSCSNCTDYQARRLQIRYRTPEGNRFVHTLNSTCVATSRALVAILENFQDAKGNVQIPRVLQPYVGGKKVIGSTQTPKKIKKIQGARK